MNNFATDKKSLSLMLAGVIVMAAGFILLSGGSSSDPQVFSYDIFDFRRLVAAPTVILAGIAVEVIAVMRKGGKEKDDK